MIVNITALKEHITENVTSSRVYGDIFIEDEGWQHGDGV